MELRRKRVLGVGVACLDLIWEVSSFPSEDSKTKANCLLTQGGGPAATALVTLARLGLSAAYFGTVGDDPAGVAIIDGLSSAGVETGLIRVLRGASSQIAAVLVSRDTGRRTVVWHPGTAPPPEHTELTDEDLLSCGFLHLDGHHPEAALPLARRARHLGVPVSLDAGSNYAWMRDLVPLADVLIGSERFARDYTGQRDPEAMAACLARQGPGIAGVTLGAGGGVIEAGGDRFTYPALPVQAVDTNGAGDVYHGAFLAALALGATPRAAAIFASATAALKCTALGGRTGIPGRGEVLAFLAERGVRDIDLGRWVEN